jgi:hypothetical protein
MNWKIWIYKTNLKKKREKILERSYNKGKKKDPRENRANRTKDETKFRPYFSALNLIETSLIFNPDSKAWYLVWFKARF